MKYPSLTASPFALLVLLLVATPGQTQDHKITNDVTPSREIAVARSRYTQAENTFPDMSESAPTEQAGPDNETLAQLARRRPGAPYPRRGGYPGRGYPSAWSSQGDGRHVLIGAAIGFGLGAAMGAKVNTNPYPGTEVRAAVLFGAFGGLIGAAIGHGVPSLYARNGRHRREPAGDEVADASPGVAQPPALSVQARVPSKSSAEHPHSAVP